MKRQFLIASMLSLLAACSSAPENRYYTLSVTPENESVTRRAHTIGLTVASVRLPGNVDRPQLVIRTGSETVDVREYDRWAESLDQMTARILGDDLILRVGMPVPGKPSNRLYVIVDEFMGSTDGSAHLTGRWWILAPGADPVDKSQNPFSLSGPAASGEPAQIAASMSKLLGLLADQIAQAGSTN